MIQRKTMTGERREARRLRAEGLSYRAIGEKLNRDQTWARRNTYDVEGGRKHSQPATHETRKTARRMRRMGVPMREIAALLKVSYESVRKWNEGNLPYLDKTKRAQLVRAKDAGMNNKQLAEAFGYSSPNTVASVLSQIKRQQSMEGDAR